MEKDEKQRPPRYCLTGGGTGGHVYPAIAIADELRRRRPDARFLYVGVRGRAEEKIVPGRGYQITFVKASGLPSGRNVVKLAQFAFAMIAGLVKAAAVMLSFKPDVVIGCGGYVSAPIVFAAIILKRLGLWKGRVFIHEQNVIPGRLNRLVASVADVAAISFRESARYLRGAKVAHLGYPVRSEIEHASRDVERRKLGLNDGEKLVLVFGGSLGARTVNRGIVEALPMLAGSPGLRIIHATGRKSGSGYDPAADVERRLAEAGGPFPFYERREYIDDIHNVYAAADLAVCRAGAGTISELAVRGLPAVLVPKANLPGDHQVCNARAVTASGAARLIYERAVWEDGEVIERIDPAELAGVVKDLLSGAEALSAMSNASRGLADAGALRRIADAIEGLSRDASYIPSGELPRGRPENDLALLGAEALASRLERIEAAGGRLSEDDLMYVRYRADGYLASDRWQARNVGVKLVGLSGCRERLPLLENMLKDRRKAGVLLRIFGGDYVQVGFIRRNIMKAIARLGAFDAGAREALFAGLGDPYFEVRAWAADAIRALGAKVGGDPEIEAALVKLSADRNFEVAREAIRALGVLSLSRDLLGRLRRFYYHPNWQVRDAAVEAMISMVERGVLSDPAEVRRELDMLLVTCCGFIPTFPLKERVGRLMAVVAGRNGNGAGNGRKV